MPELSVIAECLSAVAGFSTLTSAPTMTAPCASLTVPAMRPVVWLWDEARTAIAREMLAMRRIEIIRLDMHFQPLRLKIVSANFPNR